jgi:hypothetical protein
MTDRDPLADALALLQTRPLDSRFAAAVGAKAKAELPASPRSAPSATRIRWVLRAGLVPALLTLAAVVETAATASTVARIYGKASPTSSQ